MLSISSTRQRQPFTVLILICLFLLLPTSLPFLLPPPTTRPSLPTLRSPPRRSPPLPPSSSSSSSTSLSSSPLDPLLSLSTLASVILIHELGHYLAARTLNIKVSEFSIGFGPKLFSFTRSIINNKMNGEEENIEYSLRVLPIGGYVKFPENYNSSLVMEEELKGREKFKEKLNVEKNEKGILGMFEWLNEEEEGVVKKKVKSGSKPKITTPPKEIEYYTDPNLLQNRRPRDRFIVLSAGVVFNFLLAFILYFGSVLFGPGLLKTEINRGVLVTSEPIPYSPSSGILHKGDVISSFNGVNLLKLPSDVNVIEKEISEIIKTIKSTETGNEIEIGRGSERITIKPSLAVGRSYPTIGVSLSPNFSGVSKIKTRNVFEAVKLSVQEVCKVTKSTTKGLASFFESILPKFGGGGGGGGGVFQDLLALLNLEVT
ncbi:hypothetical protein TL16_g08957 [Triparma laevis f. inornata]|uniref:Peptidase M50 domain-containing protein n=1 Tax=Triparma laevis f. inornata TaxID=1714386 RepID=A0A9W7ELK5_9STRA|nr:hypothetical protein TL16_g08957 [Triparma laevis f. inornata]